MLQQIRASGAKTVLIVLAGIIYTVGVVYADVMFLGIVQAMFPSGFLRTFAVVGAFLAGATALLLPMAVHYWFAPGAQKIVGYLFYAVDLAVMILNVVLAFQISRGAVDANLELWRGICPAVPVMCIIGWGLLYMLDNSHKIRDTQIALHHAQVLRVAQGMEAGMNSQEVQDYLNDIGIQATKQLAMQMSGHFAPQTNLIDAPQERSTGKLPVVNGHVKNSLPPK